MRVKPLLFLLLTLAALPARAAPDIDAGRAIYERGELVDGTPLVARRAGGIELRGRDAACMNCHRRSGMGGGEGSIPVPPLVREALFGEFRKPGEQRARHDAAVRFRDFDFRTRPPYDDVTLARALREGKSTSGHTLHFLMPRYALGEADLAALTAYLRSLTTAAAPGVRGGVLRIATVLGPDADTAAFEQVLTACVAENAPRREGAPAWQLDTWRVQGAPESWPAQLDEHARRAPVFAVLSGDGMGSSAALERFCEAERLPCLFPLSAAPAADEQAVYSFVLGDGVRSEAHAIAQRLREQGVTRVTQIAGSGADAQTAARALAETLGAANITVRTRPPADAPEDGAALVLWLDGPALAAYTGAHAPPAGAPVFASGLLGGFERTRLAPAWRTTSLITWPGDAPPRWALRARQNLRPWLARNSITAGDERLQGNALTACRSFVEAVRRMQGVWTREYLLEQVERSGDAMGNAGATASSPRFLLGPNQRVASHGLYFVRLSTDGTRFTPDGEWTVP